MAVEIRVGPPTITINQGRTFMVTNKGGEIAGDNHSLGLYAMDTRFLSYYQLYINRQLWKSAEGSELTFYASRVHLSNPTIPTDDGDITKHTLLLTINRVIGSVLHEDLEIKNYSGKKVNFMLEIEMKSDFADLFEVKKGAVVQRGKILTTWDDKKQRLYTSYEHENFHRSLVYQLVHCASPVAYANGRLVFEIELEQAQTWNACAVFVMDYGQEIDDSTYMGCAEGQAATGSTGAVPGHGKELSSKVDKRQHHWRSICTGLSTSDYTLHRMYEQALQDIGALRLYDLDVSDDAWMPAAGVPWFVTLFGRDSLIVSYQAMSVSPHFAQGALKRLADYQAAERDDWLEAQPGKIMHEKRFGELTHFHQIPFSPFYATADATILYLIVLSEAYRWTGDLEQFKQYHDVAKRCLQWIDQYGDLDGDGFQEYKSFSSFKYENVAWKDSAHAVVYADGSQVQQPKGTCELQSYVYDAKVRMAEMFEALGEHEEAQRLRKQAAELKRHFNEVFWMEDEGCYGFALDPNKKLVTTVASNTGQCLWNGIAEPEQAKRIAQRLLQEDMWSGWGIRTLSKKNRAYNPLAYQRGSVWPHDNGIIAAGFKRYGLADEANQVIRAVFDAVEHFDSYRPPELYAGVQRKGDVDFPVLYPPGANIPQAWATGSIFHMVRTILGLQADAPNKRLYVWPTLPAWLSEIQLQHLRVGPCSITLRFWREGDTSRWEIRDINADDGTKQEDMIRVVDGAKRGNQ